MKILKLLRNYAPQEVPPGKVAELNSFLAPVVDYHTISFFPDFFWKLCHDHIETTSVCTRLNLQEVVEVLLERDTRNSPPFCDSGREIFQLLTLKYASIPWHLLLRILHGCAALCIHIIKWICRPIPRCFTTENYWLSIICYFINPNFFSESCVTII